MRLHLTLAMAEYRSGEIEIQSDKAQSEAAEIGAEKSVEFMEDAGFEFSEAALTALKESVSSALHPSLSLKV